MRGVLARAEPTGDVGATEAIRVDVVRTSEDFVRLEPVWRRVVDAYPCRILHLDFAWLQHWWRCFGSGRQMLVLVASDRDGVFGLAPLMADHRRIGPVAIPFLRLIGNAVSSRSDIVILRREAEAADAMLRTIDSMRWRWIDLGRVDARSPGQMAVLSAFAARHGWVRHRRSYENAEIVLAGGWQGFLAGRSRNFRASLKRARRAGASLTVARYPRDGGALDDVLRDVAAIALRSWQGREGTAVGDSPAEWSFFEGLARTSDEAGTLEIIVLRSPTEPVAFLFAVESGGALFALKMGFVADAGDAAPGMNLLAATIDAGLDRGAARIDLDVVASHGEYKYRWATELNHVDGHYLFRRGALPGLAVGLYDLRRRLSDRMFKSKPNSEQPE